MSILRRLVPLVLALAVGGAPLAFELCQIACAGGQPAAHGHADHAATAAPHRHAAQEHSCHHSTEPAAAGSAQVIAIPHACGHSDDLPAAGTPLAQLALNAPAVLTRGVIADLAPPLATLVRPSLPPRATIPIPLAVPLRV